MGAWLGHCISLAGRLEHLPPLCIVIPKSLTYIQQTANDSVDRDISSADSLRFDKCSALNPHTPPHRPTAKKPA